MEHFPGLPLVELLLSKEVKEGKRMNWEYAFNPDCSCCEGRADAMVLYKGQSLCFDCFIEQYEDVAEHLVSYLVERKGIGKEFMECLVSYLVSEGLVSVVA